MNPLPVEAGDPRPRNALESVAVDLVDVDYIDHYNQHRPHRSLQQAAPGDTNVTTIKPGQPIVRHTRCGGLINKYRQAA